MYKLIYLFLSLLTSIQHSVGNLTDTIAPAAQNHDDIAFKPPEFTKDAPGSGVILFPYHFPGGQVIMIIKLFSLLSNWFIFISHSLPLSLSTISIHRQFNTLRVLPKVFFPVRKVSSLLVSSTPWFWSRWLPFHSWPSSHSVQSWCHWFQFSSTCYRYFSPPLPENGKSVKLIWKFPS